MGTADNSDQQHMRRMTLDYSYEKLNGLLTTLTLDKERAEKEEAAETHPNLKLAHRMVAQWTGQHIDALKAAWDNGEPLEERAESQGITLTGVHDAGTAYEFDDESEEWRQKP